MTHGDANYVEEEEVGRKGRRRKEGREEESRRHTKKKRSFRVLGVSVTVDRVYAHTYTKSICFLDMSFKSSHCIYEDMRKVCVSLWLPMTHTQTVQIVIS